MDFVEEANRCRPLCREGRPILRIMARFVLEDGQTLPVCETYGAIIFAE